MKRIKTIVIITALVLVIGSILLLFFHNRGYDKVIVNDTKTAHIDRCRINESKGTWDISYTYEGYGYTDFFDGKNWKVQKVEVLPNAQGTRHTIFQMNIETGDITVSIDGDVVETLQAQTMTPDDLQRIAMSYLQNAQLTPNENGFFVNSDTYQLQIYQTESTFRVSVVDQVSDLSLTLEGGKISEVKK